MIFWYLGQSEKRQRQSRTRSLSGAGSGHTQRVVRIVRRSWLEDDLRLFLAARLALQERLQADGALGPFGVEVVVHCAIKYVQRETNRCSMAMQRVGR